jgi:hypothetical protein
MRQIDRRILAGIELALKRAGREQRKMIVWVDSRGEVHITRQGEYLPDMQLVGYTNRVGSRFEIADKVEAVVEHARHNDCGKLACWAKMRPNG